MINQVFQLYSVRMAVVFTSSLGTLWYRTKVMNRAWAVVTYGLSVVLLSIGFSHWTLLIFPAWVFAVSIGLIARNLRIRRDGLAGTVA